MSKVRGPALLPYQRDLLGWLGADVPQPAPPKRHQPRKKRQRPNRAQRRAQ